MDLLLAPVLTSLLLAQAPAPAPQTPGEVAAVQPAVPALRTPTDDFGPELKAWLDASKLQDQESASRALVGLQRLRAERNLTSVEDVAAAIAGRAEVRAAESSKGEALPALEAALTFVPDSAYALARKADAMGSTGEAWNALGVAWNNPLQHGRVLSMLLLGFLVVGALFAGGFALALLLRYAAVFGHDVAEAMPGPLKSFSLFLAVLFAALPLAGLMGWGYLPFWWLALFFIFQSKPEKAVSIGILVALALGSMMVPRVTHERAISASTSARPLYLVANGGTSVEGEALVRNRLAEDPTDMDWSLLSASMARRAGHLDEAAAVLATRASADPRFAHNAAAIELMRGNFAGAISGFTQASEASLPATARATAFYNLSLAQVNTLAFDESKESRRKGDALDAATLARYDQLFSFDRDGSTLQAPPDIVPPPSLVVGNALPAFEFSGDNLGNRFLVIAVALLVFIPGILKFRGAQSFSKQCPKCGTTFCWLCQTRSTSQDVCSQCHHLFVVKRGIPPAARAAKAQDIARYTTVREILHRVASLAAPGAGHLSVGHFTVGFPLLLVWALGAGAWVTVSSLAPLLVTAGPLGPAIKTGASVFAGLAYVLAQVVKPRPPAVVTVRRSRDEEGA